ncbi:uncharacterized protein LOC119324593 isoform X2 [Triticum dicoccoides]|uniref:uncharacterized protein LOC119324593 isoform X2 n=1 Tax=Triticum dicoccoides TaxID=85692 RepID=UPI00188E83C4|nr:uncharacterized protein LOC119324593 isoform X2 [Triticum dicoccoides]
MGGTRGRMGISYLHSHGGGNVDSMAQQRRLGSLWIFLRQQDVGKSITAGNGSSDLLRIFSMSTWDDTNSNIMFSAPDSKKAEVLSDSDVSMVTNFSNIDSQLALSSWTCPGWTTTCNCSRTPSTTESMPSVAAPLTRRASLGRERRTRINKRLRRLQRPHSLHGQGHKANTHSGNMRPTSPRSRIVYSGYSVPQALQNNAQSNFNSGHDNIKLLSSILKKRLTRINGHALRKIGKEYVIFLE